MVIRASDEFGGRRGVFRWSNREDGDKSVNRSAGWLGRHNRLRASETSECKLLTVDLIRFGSVYKG